MECSICYEDYNNKVNKECKCPFCPFSCCRECVKTYIFGNLNEPHCMNCKNELSVDVLSTFFTKTFMNKDYKENRKNILFEREKSLFAETLRTLGVETSKKELMEKKKEMKRKYMEAIRDIERELSKLETEKPKDEKVIVRNCPVQNCKGYIDSVFKCTICNTKVCNQCYEVESVGHVCNEDTIKTLKFMLEDTQGCPKCAVRIHKIEGCDQMWCTNCNVAFSYRTGRLITGQGIHNPHFAEFLRNGGQVDGNMYGCRETFGFHLVRSIRDRIKNDIDNNNLLNPFINACIAVTHINDVIIRTLNRQEYGVETNKDLRFKLLKGEMQEGDMKTLLIRREKDARFKEELRNIFQSCVVIMDRLCLDIDRNCDIRTKNVPVVEEKINEIIKLVEATNKSLEELHKKYNRGTYKIEGAEVKVAYVKSKTRTENVADAPRRRRRVVHEEVVVDRLHGPPRLPPRLPPRPIPVEVVALVIDRELRRRANE